MGMTCWSVKRRMNDYVDGRLRGGELTRFESHLSECGECELRIDEVRSVRSSLRSLPASQMPAKPGISHCFHAMGLGPFAS